jgi:hypothetical protein
MVRSEKLFALVVFLSVGLACRVTIPEGALFTCVEDADCGGDGYVCAPRPGSSGVCCLSTTETCNGLDDDCDGQADNGVPEDGCYTGPEGTLGVGRCRAGTRPCQEGAIAEACVGEVLPLEEQCNGEDDDCDGQVDDGFDFQNDRHHCGGCNIACTPQENCVAGGCLSSSETQCDDGMDNNNDGLIDCDDPLCDGRSCGTGCLCIGTTPTELECGDGADNDQDGLTDCADPQCDDVACGPGCLCAGGAGKELDCSDGLDNDGDGLFDCQDPDCAMLSCMAAPATFTCDAQLACSCGGNPTPPPESSCTNGQDEDCDGLVDCADPDCANQACGAGCTCKAGNKSETNCADRADNDGDMLIDCADALDCPETTPCTFVQGMMVKNGTCQPNGTCK